jgi:hypothetical protein
MTMFDFLELHYLDFATVVVALIVILAYKVLK